MPGYPLPEMARKAGAGLRPVPALVLARSGRVVRPARWLFLTVKAGSYRLMAGVVGIGLLPVQR